MLCIEGTNSLEHYRNSCYFAVILSRIQYLVAPSSVSSQPPLIRLDPKTVKMAKAYAGSSSPGNDFDMKSGSLSSTLEKLYVWEKKLYKEVKVLMNISYMLVFAF